MHNALGISNLLLLLFSIVGCTSNVVHLASLSPEQLYSKAEQQFIRGDLETAKGYAEEGLQRFSGSTVWTSSFRVELAKILLYKGESERAVSFLKQPACDCDKQDVVIHRDLFLAVGELRLGNKEASGTALEAAIKIHPIGTLHTELTAIQGVLAIAENNLDTAQSLLAQALVESTDGEEVFQQIQILMNLGVIALRRQHFEEANSSFHKALALASSIDARQAVEKATGNIGRVYYQTGDFQLARENLELAANQARRLGAIYDEVYWLTNAGLNQFGQGDFRAAQSSLDQSLHLAKKIGNKALEYDAERAISYLLISQKSNLAIKHIGEVKRLALLGPDRSEDLEASLLESFSAIQKSRILEAEHKLLYVERSADAPPSLRWEAENTLAALYDKTGRQQLAEHWYQRTIETFHQQRLTLMTVELELPFLENGSNLYMGYMEHLIRAGRTGKALALLDTSRAETLAEGLGTAPARTGKAADPQAVAGRLRATILVYCLRPERSYLWAITGKEQAFYTLPGSGAILPLVARHNEAILGAKDLLTQKDSPGRALYDTLLAPAAGLLPKDGGRVVLVADSALSRLNFETLIAPGDPAKGAFPHYWVEDVSVTNARSLRLLAAGGQAHRTEPKAVSDAPKMLLIGDPIYAKGEYAPLPNAGAEMAGIAEHFAPGERVVAARQEASPAIYEASRPGRFRFLHFVAHATASELNPLDSAVILSSKNTGAGGATNKLYASEILKLPLSAELVTLSSCYSSGTRNYTGEGVVGLAWAFLRTGAHSVIGALWDVSDVSTPKLMDTMYTRLLAGDAPDAALRAAKLEMLHSDGVFRKPVYWGAFQLYAGR